MDKFTQMAQIQSVLFIYMVLGYIGRKANLLKSQARPTINNILLYFSLPCMIFQSFNMQFTAETFRTGVVAMLAATFSAVTALVLGNFIYRWVPEDEQPIMKYGTLVSNSGFAGLPVLEAAYGSEGLFLGSLYIIPTRILMWSAGISLFTNAPLKQRIVKVITNPGIVAVFFGFGRMALQPQIPAQINKALSTLGSMTTPLAMMMIGMILAEIDIKTVLDKKAFILAGIRQFVLPFIALVVLRAFHVDPLTIAVAVILTGMPIGSTTALLADQYGANAHFGSKCVFVSTLTSLVTIPILTLFL